MGMKQTIIHSLGEKPSMKIYFTLAVLFILLLPATASCKHDVIIWCYAEYPPGFIDKGQMKDEGYHQVFERYLARNLPEYKHKYLPANFSRIEKQIQTSNSCAVALMKTPEREEYMTFSTPAMIGLPNGVHVLSSRLGEFKPFIDGEGYISLEKIFKYGSLKLGISKGRNYGGEIDEIISNNMDSGKIIVQYTKDTFAGLVNVMHAERSIDYVLGYPQEMKWLTYQGLYKNEFTFIPIKEGPRYVVSYVACPKNQWGERLISKVNRILGGKFYSEYKKQYQKFLPPEAIRLHNRYCNEVFPVKRNI